ncbi:tyrosyl-DNA phosphodiesterase 2-like [Lineus longissimus]|uniref:tyrosyl-DNA phosphodiesterase 2-like n=1 Tax=Lineus longissimus TaxID=88925 RepID=UPI002B4F8C45
MSGSDSEMSDDNLDGAVCEQLCQEFAGITGTDSALAMYFLQNRKWNLQNALNMFFEEFDKKDGPFILGDKSEVFKKPAESGATGSAGPVKVVSLTFNPGGDGAQSSNATRPDVVHGASQNNRDRDRDRDRNRIRLLSWNIDGLDTNNIFTRTKAVCDLIKKENPDVVFLQEVVPNTYRVIKESLADYLMIPGNDEGYFTAILLRRTTVECESHEVLQFYTSMMARNLLVVEAKVKGKSFKLMTSHLESTKDHAEERIRQLKTAFKMMEDAPASQTVIFGGDCNLRDKELQSIGGTPPDIHDVWELTGKRRMAQFTWDQQRNDNLGMDGKFKPKLRFDRIYIRSSDPMCVKPVYFELVGLERVPACKRFPSDHWGILTHYDIK